MPGFADHGSHVLICTSPGRSYAAHVGECVLLFDIVVTYFHWRMFSDLLHGLFLINLQSYLCCFPNLFLGFALNIIGALGHRTPVIYIVEVFQTL